MKIAINAVPLLSPLTGIGQYTYHLAKGLLERRDIELDFFYATGWSKELRTKPVKKMATFKSLFKRLIPRAYVTSRYLQQSNFNNGLKNKKIDLYHEPNFLPFKFKGPTILTVHDLSWIRFPDMHPAERVDAMNRYFETGLRRADLIITDSEFVKQELIDEFNIRPNTIKAISLGVEPLFKPRDSHETQSILTHHRLIHGQYFISVGTLEPRKNLQTTLRAYMQLSPSIRKQYPLIIVGMNGWHTSELEQQINPLILAGEIRQIGYLPREELAILMSAALTLIFPSIYEGFGLPPLEAMACGVPVIASNGSSLPEVVGDTGFLIAPHDVESLTNAMETLIAKPGIRQTLSEKAQIRSLNFSWENCVSQTIEAYRQVYS